MAGAHVRARPPDICRVSFEPTEPRDEAPKPGDSPSTKKIFDAIVDETDRIVAADPDGMCADLRPREVLADDDGGEILLVEAGSGTLTPGMRLSSRCNAGPRVWVIAFEVADVADTGFGRADVRLRMLEGRELPDSRHAPRYGYDGEGTVAPALDLLDAAEGASALSRPIRMSEVASHGVAFLDDRDIQPGRELDITFADDTGGRIRARVQVVRSDRAGYGRIRHAARLMALSELDSLRLERLCARLRHTAESRGTAAVAVELGDIRPKERSTGIRRLFSRS